MYKTNLMGVENKSRTHTLLIVKALQISWLDKMLENKVSIKVFNALIRNIIELAKLIIV